MSQNTTEKLAKLVTQRRQCLVQMRDLGRKQSELIATGDMGPLLRLLSAKQQLITALQTIERELSPFHEDDPESRDWSSPESRTRCARQAADCRQLLSEVMQLEKQNEQQITVRRDEVASQLQTAHAASLARGAYQSQQMPASTKSQTTSQPISFRGTNGQAGNSPHGNLLDIQSEVSH